MAKAQFVSRARQTGNQRDSRNILAAPDWKIINLFRNDLKIQRKSEKICNLSKICEAPCAGQFRVLFFGENARFCQ
jgi:hypothetical protein